jgi:putative membrane protein
VVPLPDADVCLDSGFFGKGSDMQFTYALLATALAVAGLSRVVETVHPPDQQKLDDAAILATLDFLHTAEIESGQLAQEKGTAQEVKDLGRSFVAAHTQARDEARALAEQLGLKPRLPGSDPAAREHGEALTRLRGQDGKAFDRAFIDHEVAFHQSALEKVKTSLIPSAKRPELRAYLQRLAPGLQVHLEEARALQTRIVAFAGVLGRP